MMCLFVPRKFDVIELLLQTGAHLVESSSDIASMLCKYVYLLILLLFVFLLYLQSKT